MAKMYTKDELIWYLRDIWHITGKIPTSSDFNVKGKPRLGTFAYNFGSFINALEAAGFDVSNYTVAKGRKAELTILKLFTKDGALDISGKDWNSEFDGYCPTGKKYDVKSSKITYFSYGVGSWQYTIKHQGVIDYFFLLGYDHNHKKLLHIWRVPGNKFINKRLINIADNKPGLVKWKEYEIPIEIIEV